MLRKSDFYYDLPEDLIAQTPIEPRNHSRLLVADREKGFVCHSQFYRLFDFLKKGDLLVMNNSKVIPARLYCDIKGRETGGEILLLKQKNADCWEAIVKPGKKLKKGAEFSIGEYLKGEVLEVLEDGNRILKFYFEGNFYEILDKIGNMPLPPYITEKLKDKNRYQTVYAKENGSAAAPTAGLHFTNEMIEELKEKGINIAYVTLHVGLGTFRPVKEDIITDHKMHTESFYVPDETAELIKRTKAAGGRVISVGTTSLRTLESAFSETKELIKKEGSTDIFIYPPYKFKVIDGLITNFHLPESTLIMLVSALLGRENTMNCYKIAVEEKYRFFSFGDAMLIL
ncbi:MAG: tRNA preQ1(34) S-adenosylmethionine ribosyltransferase-isomerase QueA [Oscillospiraceae bacterium]|nr:tRNA preQ1(34) S-adenosylmethionine ribosyltransferase-isomerase QueA [Oscillospiraceae bacterium]